jgi:hypothetical protein
MASLNWTRIKDGTHGDRPVYEYEAVSGGIKYHVWWACDRGGMFGLSISYADRSGYPDDVRSGIMWLRSLKNCKSWAEDYAAKRMAKEAA